MTTLDSHPRDHDHEAAHITRIVPKTLYSTITQYTPSQVIVEHFPTKAARTGDLLARASQFFNDPDCVPEIVRADEQRLAALVSTLLMPAVITLVEARFNDTDDTYRPTGSRLPVR